MLGACSAAQPVGGVWGCSAGGARPGKMREGCIWVAGGCDTSFQTCSGSCGCEHASMRKNSSA
eukprot:13006652-Alexandrium_andersonii.AAC.1